MKKNTLSGLSLLGVIILFILHFTSGTDNPETQNEENNVEVELTDTTSNEVQIIDTTNIEELAPASYSKVGYCDIVKVITDCPYLAKKFNNTKSKLENLQEKEYNIKKELFDYQQAKQKELEEKNNQGLLLPQTYQMEERKLMEKQQIAEKQIMAMQPTLEAIQRQEAKNVEERDKIIREALEEVNKIAQLDFVLVNNGTMTNVYHFSEKNHITNQVIKVINGKY